MSRVADPPIPPAFVNRIARKRRSRSASLTACMATLFAIALPALASDGVREINQACALNTGCFPGDSAGFPVTITARGSFRLTSDLDLSAQSPNLSGVVITAQFVTLDLGGFSIHGPAGCSGTPTTSCAPAGTGVGVDGVSFLTLRNGIVSGMASDGVRLQHGVRIDDIQSFANGGSGVVAGDQSEMRWVESTLNAQHGILTNIEATLDHVSAVGNGGDGLHVASGVLTDDNASRNGGAGANLGLTTAFSGCRLASNGGGSLVGGKAVGGNVCDDGRCSTTGGKRYYLTIPAFDGAHAATACNPGFHMASLYEMLDPASLQYDKTLGRGTLDQGAGPPSGQVDTFLVLAGWVRTGADPDLGLATAPGRANCNAWTTTSGRGTVAALSTPWSAFPSSPVVNEVSPFEATTWPCNLTSQVWCMED